MDESSLQTSGSTLEPPEDAPQGFLNAPAAMQMEMESVAPFIAPLIVVLKEASGVVGHAFFNKTELRELLVLCADITGQAIQTIQDRSSSLDVSPLQECIEELKDVAESCGDGMSSTWEVVDRIQNLRTCISTVNIWHEIEDISQTPARGPTLFILASHVYPGFRVLESRRHGVRLTVPDDSLDSAIGPIAIQELAQVVKCKNDSMRYLVTTVVDCQPSGIKFPRKPLLLEFRVHGTSAAEISERFQVLVRENQAGSWCKVASSVHEDKSGAHFLRAAVNGFSCFSAAAVVNPANPFSTEVCETEGRIGLGNSTNVKAYFVFVPTSFDTANTVRDNHNAGGNLGGAGATFGANYGAEHEQSTTRQQLPAATTPSEFVLLPGGSLEFSPPTGTSGGHLVIAMLPAQPRLSPSVRVVDYYTQFPVREGTTITVLQGCLEGGRLDRAKVVPGDKLVNAALVMAGLRPESRDAVTVATVASSPQSMIGMAAAPPGPTLAPSTSVRSTVPATSHSRSGTVRTCSIS